MKSINEIMRGRVDSLDMGREDQLAAIQEILHDLYPGKIRARRLQSGVLTIETPSATVASDVRLRQEELLERLDQYSVVQFKVAIS